jgi:outer membrane lipoprotein-sorting protein
MCLSQAAVAAESKAPAATLSAAQIVDKHIAARGGLQAWHEVQTLSVAGKMDAGTGDSAARSAILAKAGAGASARRPAGGAAAGPEKPAEKPQVQLPFRLEMKRPRKSRLEIDFAGKTAVQVYDGQNGWKLRPYLNRNDVEPFSEQEVKAQSDTGDLEGPLVDYAAKGTKIALEGVEPVDGRNAYKLLLTRKSGDAQHIWIDAQSFLDVKIEGIPRRMDGKIHKVWISQRDFRLVQGVMIPFVVETAVEGYQETHKMLIEKVTLNQKLDDAVFGKPAA